MRQKLKTKTRYEELDNKNHYRRDFRCSRSSFIHASRGHGVAV